MNTETLLVWSKIFGFIGAFCVLASSFGVWKFESRLNKEKDRKIEELVEGNTELNKKMDVLLERIIGDQNQYLKEQYEIQLASGRLIPPVAGRDEGPYKLIFGTNTFINTPSVLVIDGIPLITMKIINNTLLLSTTIYGEHGQVLAIIRDNDWIFEQIPKLRKEIKPNLIKLWDDKDRLILDCELLSNKVIKLNGIFRKGNAEIIASDKNLIVNSRGSFIGLGGSGK